jgi:hypothetical protein
MKKVMALLGRRPVSKEHGNKGFMKVCSLSPKCQIRCLDCYLVNQENFKSKRLRKFVGEEN